MSGPANLLKRLGREPPVGMLLHPVTLGALALMALNDGWLRAAHPCWFTGKLSDFAAVVVFPGVVAAFWGLIVMAVDRLLGLFSPLGGVDYSLRSGVALGAIAFTGGVLVGINISPAFRDVYLGLLARLDVLDLFGPFHYTLDPSDLVALCFLPIPWLVAERRIRRIPAGRLRAALRLALRRVARKDTDVAREAVARQAVQASLADVRRGLDPERVSGLEAVTDLLVQAAVDPDRFADRGSQTSDEPNLAPKELDHYHRIHQAVETFRMRGNTP